MALEPAHRQEGVALELAHRHQWVAVLAFLARQGGHRDPPCQETPGIPSGELAASEGAGLPDLYRYPLGSLAAYQ